jgi:hypothetical protein
MLGHPNWYLMTENYYLDFGGGGVGMLLVPRVKNWGDFAFVPFSRMI